VLIDAKAGLEHFGRRVDAACDLIICIVDPSFESIQMADRTKRLALLEPLLSSICEIKI
jgi:CO dehydrogenase maturation factor